MIVSLYGGPRDGERLAIRVSLETLNFPVAPSKVELDAMHPADPITFSTIVYRRTKSYTSDGARIYAFDVPTHPDNENPTTEGTQDQ